MRSRVRILVALGCLAMVAGVVTGLGTGKESRVSIPAPSGPSAAAPATTAAGQATAGPARYAEPPPARPQRRTGVTPRRTGRAPAHLDAVATTAGFTGVPAVALAAYERASRLLAARDPACGITWEDLAGIGRVESGNGLTWGSLASVSPGGTLSPPIYGPLLDGRDGMPAIATPDGGALEGTTDWERAVGPMQFLPSTWLEYAPTATGKAVADPQNFFDAALTAGVYLCDNGGNLATRAGLTQAIYAYNHSKSYVEIVEAWIAYYSGAGTGSLLTAAAGMLPVSSTPARAPKASTARHHRAGAKQPTRRRAPGTTTTTAPTRRPTTTSTSTSTSTTSTTSTSTTTTTTTTVPVTVPVTVTTVPFVHL